MLSGVLVPLLVVLGVAIGMCFALSQLRSEQWRRPLASIIIFGPILATTLYAVPELMRPSHNAEQALAQGLLTIALAVAGLFWPSGALIGYLLGRPEGRYPSSPVVRRWLMLSAGTMIAVGVLLIGWLGA